MKWEGIEDPGVRLLPFRRASEIAVAKSEMNNGGGDFPSKLKSFKCAL